MEKSESNQENGGGYNIPEWMVILERILEENGGTLDIKDNFN